VETDVVALEVRHFFQAHLVEVIKGELHRRNTYIVQLNMLFLPLGAACPARTERENTPARSSRVAAAALGLAPLAPAGKRDLTCESGYETNNRGCHVGIYWC